MSQHDFIIDNQFFPATRADLNNSLVALASNSSGDAEPTTTYANQWWYETDSNTLKLRNEANTAWVTICTLDQGNNNVLSITTQGLTLGTTTITASGTEINQLAAITRGSLIYGNASGVTSRLAKGAADTVLTSDGTDISWTTGAAIGVPTGSVITLAMSTVPTGWLECDGAAISRSTYSVLFSTLTTSYGAGDGSTTFNLPDLRGEFVRGWDHGKGTDSGRSIATAQGDELKSHSHTITMFRDNFHNTRPLGGGSNASLTGATNSFGGSETRPRNVAMMYCIKY